MGPQKDTFRDDPEPHGPQEARRRDQDDTVVSNGVAIGVPIGEFEPHVFACPDCGRPLSDGTSRCPGCGVRLTLGVPVKRAGAILALGLVVGFLFGGVVTVAATFLSAHAASAAGVADPTPAPAVTAAPGEVPVVVGVRRPPSRP